MRDGFTDAERRARIDLPALERGVREQNRARVIKAAAALAGHQTQRNAGRRAKPARTERARVGRQRNQTLGLFAFIRARAFRQIRADPLTVSAAIDAIPTTCDKEWQRMQSLFENTVAVRALFSAGRNRVGAAYGQTKDIIVGPGNSERGVRRGIPQR